MCAYRRDYDKTKYMPFFIKSNQLLVNLIVYNKKYLKTKIKSHNRKMKTNFHNNEIQNECSNVFVYQ